MAFAAKQLRVVVRHKHLKAYTTKASHTNTHTHTHMSIHTYPHTPKLFWAELSCAELSATFLRNFALLFMRLVSLVHSSSGGGGGGDAGSGERLSAGDWYMYSIPFRFLTRADSFSSVIKIYWAMSWSCQSRYQKHLIFDFILSVSNKRPRDPVKDKRKRGRTKEGHWKEGKEKQQPHQRPTPHACDPRAL